MKTKALKVLKEKDVDFIIEADFDDLQVRGNAIASGDDAEDKRVEDEIIRRLENGDVWAWASVKVIARWNVFEGHDYLGACCYKDENDFKQAGGYYDDKKQAALDDLNRQIKETSDRLDVLK